MTIKTEITLDALINVEDKARDREERSKGKKAPFIKDKDGEYFDRLLDHMLTRDSEKPKASASELIKALNSGDPNGPIIRSFRTSILASQPCKRFMVMQTVYPGQAEKISGRVAAIFDDGDWRHKRVQEWAQRIERLKAAKVHEIEGEFLYLPLRHSGHADVILSFNVRPLNKLGKVLLELKGIKDSNFKDLWCPKWDHYMQAQIYLHRHKVKWAFVVYENKDNQGRRIYKVAYDPKVGKDIDELLVRLNKYVDRLRFTHDDPHKGDLPPQEIDAWCKTCPQHDKCFALAEKGV